MTFLSSLRRHTWIVPVVLSLWGAWPAPASSATSAPALPAHDGHASPTGSDDPASPDALAGPLPVGVLHDFSRPALSVPTGDWRKVNASVSAMTDMTEMSGSRHDMGGATAAPVNGHAGHAGHGTQGGAR
ncbi:hypothetical protein [Pandoraea fibrosis]|uniref:hypothetical protein n=1 Tax=Pandoraea fibrosis TaxID=1891094 RepID=UPI001241A0E1|nr:hypothetical protein [Pandoraea fibrosis]